MVSELNGLSCTFLVSIKMNGSYKKARIKRMNEVHSTTATKLQWLASKKQLKSNFYFKILLATNQLQQRNSTPISV